jgi:cell fate regulator YaaT (PSP1 superfamily)
MSCENCGSCSTENGTPKGCGDKGNCGTGGCNKLNTFDWLSDIEQPDNQAFDIVEIGFKNNARKEFFKKPAYLHLVLGDSVLVESTGGFDVGSVSLSGELVKLQMQKKRVRESSNFPPILRRANERDLERLVEVRSLEKDILIQARAVSRQLNLDMKIGDVEFQGDGRKITFFYTSEGRVDFRELIRIYAKEFKVKIEMRQIGARQESARLGGIGTCGRELCCSTWLADFKSVSTVAARYQNLAINQSKLSGQCGRLKCCLNYELKTYLDALRDIPRNIERLETERGLAVMVKMDIFKKIMYFGYKQPFGVTDIQPLPIEQVRLIHQLNKEGLKPVALNQLTSDALPVDFHQKLNGEQQDKRARHREQGQNLHKQIAENVQTQEDEAIVLPAMNERRKKKTVGTNPNPNPNSKNPNPNIKNKPVKNTEKIGLEMEDTEPNPTVNVENQNIENSQNTEKKPVKTQNPQQTPRQRTPNHNANAKNPNYKPKPSNMEKTGLDISNKEQNPAIHVDNQNTENPQNVENKPVKNPNSQQTPRQRTPNHNANAKNPNYKPKLTNMEKTGLDISSKEQNPAIHVDNQNTENPQNIENKPVKNPNSQQNRRNNQRPPRNSQQNKTDFSTPPPPPTNE